MPLLQCLYPCTSETHMCPHCREALSLYRLKRLKPDQFARAYWQRRRKQRERAQLAAFEALCEEAYTPPLSAYMPPSTDSTTTTAKG